VNVPALDRHIGLLCYVTKTEGIQGVIRKDPADFVVREVLVDGSTAQIDQPVNNPVLGSTATKQPYFLCILAKRNWDTIIAVKQIAEQMGIDPARIDIAGIKDAKAKTAQHITIEGGSPESISKVNIKDIAVHPVGYFRDKMSSYFLMGNHFNITIRAIVLEKTKLEEQISESAKQLTELGGIPNFFGHQRFGTSRSITHLVGKAIVKGRFDEAAMLFLAKHSQDEHPDSMKVRMNLESTRDFRHALKDFPRQLRFERLMLVHLSENPEDFTGSFRRLPIKLRKLFVQAYQSYLFNKFLSQRILNGLPLNAAVPGDYVVNLERSGLPMVQTGRVVSSDQISRINELIRAGKMRVALPMFGARQKLSQGKMGEAENEIIASEELKMQDFVVDGMPEIGCAGGLRAIVSPVSDLKQGNVASDSINNQKVDFEFTLMKGSYATMLLRELMKPKDPFVAGF
jgi:tRNA pseudouridine13 synthase